MDSDADPTPPELAFFARLSIHVDTPVETGEMSDGRHRIIHITGGTIEGPVIQGSILPAGADFQIIRSDTTVELLAKYALRTNDGEYVVVENLGVRTADAEDTRRLAEGEPVPPERVYFRCVPRMKGSGEWAWLQERIFVGTGQRFPDRVQVDLFEVL